MNSLYPKWRFRRMNPGEMNIDPIEAEFFSTEALESLADALVREAVQNSLDARLPGTPARMRFALSTPDSLLRGDDKARYLVGLNAHLGASRSGLAEPPASDEPLSFLVVEDFGTRGLQGDPAQSEDETIDDDSSLRNDFFYFWRNIGRSRKHAAELGRWGLGKTVFQAASRINAFFGLTVRADDKRCMLLGQSVLRIHRLDGARYYPYGYFGHFEEDFALPLEAPDWVHRFSRDFALARNDEPGLSVIVPYPDADLSVESIAASVVRHYFLPIISGDLVVEVEGRDGSVHLDASSLAPAESAGGIVRPGLFELAKWGLELDSADHYRLPAPPDAAAPRWAGKPVDDGAVAALRARFDTGERIALTVPVYVKPVGETPILSSFDIYLERDQTEIDAEQHYVRDGITIAGVRSALPKGIRSLLVVRDPPLSRLLGDSENPAHTEWQERSPKFKDRYRHGPFTLRYVKNAPREIVRLLTQPAEGRDYRLLTQLFSLEMPNEQRLRNRKADQTVEAGTGAEGGDNGAEIVGKDRDFQIQRLKGGFRVSGVNRGSDTTRFAAIWAAYDTRRGNPFKQWQAPDFVLERPPIDIDVSGARIVSCKDCVLVLRFDGDFRVTVKGFDPRRDVRVRIQPLDPEAL